MPLYRASKNFTVLANSAVAVPLTATTSETILATINIPANSMGPNGIIRVTTIVTNTNSVDAKTARVRFGGIGGTDYLGSAQTTQTNMHTYRLIQNRNSLSSQIGTASGLSNVMAPTSVAPATSTVNTGADTTIVITGQLANAADTMTLESYFVELMYRP
jgi:hypothetical protein